MSVAFDFHTLSLTIDYTLEEYQKSTGSGDLVALMGIHLPEAGPVDRSKFLRFRHEHAHFTSFMATGLAELYGIFSDYLLVFLFRVLQGNAEDLAGIELELPLLMGEADDRLDDRTREIILRAWQQINHARAFFFGFGTRLSLAGLVDMQPQDDFWSIYFDERFTPIVQRYYRLIASLKPEKADDPCLSQNRALPSILIQGRPRELTSRGVMEAYAITIELLNTHFRKMESDLTFYGSPLVRDPGPLYTTAIEYALEHAGLPQSTTLEEYLAGKSPPEAYYLITALSFAAMQTPVVQKLDGEVIFEGNLHTLCSAYRFQGMVEALKEGKIPPLPADVRRKSDRAGLLTWLHACNEALGDTVSLNIYGYVGRMFNQEARLQNMTRESQSLIELSWAARANFIKEPTEYVLDAGLFAEIFPCQVRYIRTLDGKIVAFGDTGTIQALLISESAVPAFEAAVFANQWDSAWAKMTEVSPDERAGRIALSLLSTAHLFGYIDQTQNPEMPKISLRI